LPLPLPLLSKISLPLLNLEGVKTDLFLGEALALAAAPGLPKAAFLLKIGEEEVRLSLTKFPLEVGF